MDILQLISAAGFGGIVGSLLTTIVQSFLSEKSRIDERNFQEKKEAYTGALSAYQNVCLNNDKKGVLKFALWVDRCELVANKQLIDQLNQMKTEDFTIQKEAFSQAKKMMRKDLGFKK